MRKVLLLLSLVFVLQANGQEFTNYSATDGLETGGVSTVIQDRDGKMWFVDWGLSAPAGIANFDGENFTLFSAGDGPTSNNYRTMIQDSDHNYWFGSFIDYTGIDYFDGDTWTNYQPNISEEPISGIMRIIQDQNDDIWFVGHGLTRFDGQGFEFFGLDEGLPSLVTLDISVDSSGTLWLGTDLGLVSYDGAQFIVHGAAGEELGGGYITVFVDSNDDVWAGNHTEDGIVKFDGANFTKYTTEEGLPGSGLRAMTEDSNGNIWFGTADSGVSYFDGTNFTNLDVTDGLLDNHVRALTEDNDGNIWIGNWEGVSVYSPALGVFDTLKTELTIAPNPTSQNLRISYDGIVSQASIYNITGSLVREYENSNIQDVDVSALEAGMYWLKITDDNGLTGFKKFIVQ